MVLTLPNTLRSLIGKTIQNDDYKIVEYCKSGKRGHLFRAERKYGGERALKFIPNKNLSHGWEQEARKAHLLEQQPNTVKFYEIFFHGEDYSVMVFDFVRGTTLKDYIKKRKLTVGDIQRILENLLFFRRDCLEKNLRHGDLHPGNIILREPVMGIPRAYDVMITDFGIGYTGAVLQPKDDSVQIGLIATLMLQSNDRENLTQSDRFFYDELCNGATIKQLREGSPLERGDERAAIQRLIDELTQIGKLAYKTQSVPIRQPRFGDYLAGEQLGNRWKEWKELFVSSFPGYEDIVSRNITVLTGTRGCGKTMVFRRLSKLLAFEVGPVDEKAAGELVGIYLNMNDIADAFLFDQQKPPHKDLAIRVIQFFHLSLLSEIIRTAATAREKESDGRQVVLNKANHQLFDLIIEQLAPETLYPGPGLEMRVVASLVEATKDKVRREKKVLSHLMEMAQNDWLKRFIPKLQQIMPWIGDRPLHFFIDDYSLPRVGQVLQKILNSVIFQRSDSFFFKISTESPSTLYRKDYSDKVLDGPHDFELTDLGSVTIDLPDEKRESFLDDVFIRRLAREDMYRGITLAQMLGKFEKSWAELARRIRKQLGTETDNLQSMQSSKNQTLYHGREIFVNMWSGDTRSMVKVAQNLFEQALDKQSLNLPISPKLQDKVFRNTGGQFLHLLRACARTVKDSKAKLPDHIVSWGEHLVEIAEAFKEISLHELRTRYGGRKGRDEPKQAFRIEIVDQFALEGIEREIYEDLVRYGVFLRDDRGKSIRGAIIPRLYLRRLLIPYCTLTFSKIDNIAMKAADFKYLLLHPRDFTQEWKKSRERFNINQLRLFD
jgi:tRNA A-37 threonylcarbamoyl transferase component Bud32